MKTTALLFSLPMAFLTFSATLAFAGPVDDCESIREKIRALPASGGEVVIPVGTYNCSQPIVLDRSNVKLRGADSDATKTIIRLTDGKHAPLLIIGDRHTHKNDQGAYVTSHRVQNVSVANLTFDGNKANHDTSRECGEGICEGDPNAVRNNGITIRGASYIYVKNVIAHDMISGGMVTEKYCDHLYVDGFKSFNNFFDGFAGYETVDSQFSNMHLHDNHGAAVSLDINFNNNVMFNSLFEGNKDVGIFGRFMSGNRFQGINIQNAGGYGVFLAASDGAMTCAINNDFINVNINGSKLAPFRVNDGCGGNRISGTSDLSKNGEVGIVEARPGSVILGTNIKMR